MPNLSVEIKTVKMVTSTKLFRLVAGIENLYYALLLTGDQTHSAIRNQTSIKST